MAERIVVADDEPFILRSLAYVLRHAGFDVSEARDGQEALSVIRECRPQIVFLDVMMPRMDGYAVCSELRADEDLKDCYVIMLTAKGQEADRERGLSAGADEYLTKPFSPSRITQRVREILGAPEGV